MSLIDIPVDQSRLTAPMVCAGAPVEKITEFDAKVPAADRVQSLDKVTRQPLWRGYVFVPGSDTGRPEMIAVKIAQPYPPVMGGFGEVIEFENLVAVPYVAQGTTKIAVSFKATGIVPVTVGRKGEAA